MKKLLKNFILIILIFLLISGIFALFSPQTFKKVNEIPFSKLALEVSEGKIREIKVTGSDLQIVYKSGEKALSRKETGVSLVESLLSYGIDREMLKDIKIEIEKEKESSLTWLLFLGAFLLPILIFVWFFWMIFKQAKTGASQTFSFLKAPAKLFSRGKVAGEKVTFKDIAGLQEAKEEIKEVVDFLKNPKKYFKIGARIPRGVLLVGPPGTGKTLMARAVANESGVPFFSIAGSEFIELFVGVGSSSSYDTNILVRTKDWTRLMPIGEFVDRFYNENEEGLKPIEGVQTLGIEFARGNKFLKCANWKKVKAVYRHKVDKIYEIEFIGGKIKVTGDHSVFIRKWNHIVPKKVSELKVGEILVGLPFSVRGRYNQKLPLGNRTPHYAKAHKFPEELPNKEIVIWSLENNNFGLPSTPLVPGSIAKILGLSNGRAVGVETLAPQKLENLVYKIKITPALMKLLGYYTAEGDYHNTGVRFSFGLHETNYHRDCVKLIKEIFNLKPTFRQVRNDSLVIRFGSAPIGRFFAKQCGQGAPNKHVPEFIWDLPREYLVSYLDGLVKGDGWINKRKMIEFSSSSKQLISELRWLLNMHGIPCSVTKYKKPAGHRIKNGKPLPESTYWRITVATLINPLNPNSCPRHFKRPIIKKITIKPYNGYVYDLCGCENEAFFGGEKPVLLHNSRVRQLFAEAKKHPKSIIFIDELDAIGKVRMPGIGGGHEEREQTLNQILAEMDGFERESGTIIIAATNRPEQLDPALLRPGRFDRRIVLDLPDVKGREEILKIHCRGKPLALDVNLKEIAERTPGFSGADLANLVNEAAILAARRNKHQIYQEELLESIEKVLLGPERKSHLLSKAEKEISAFHETGHALVSASIPEAETVRKVSIISRGMTAGYTLALPKREKRIKQKSEFLAELAVLLGGYCAEKLKFKEISTGASNDLEKASILARSLVTKYGMSKLGPISFGKRESLPFLGWEQETERNYSEKIAQEIDKETERFIKEAEKKATGILKKRRKTLERIAKVLIKKETIEKEEFEKLVRGGVKKVPKKKKRKE
ncbi:ATP-dependent metallopeptidase FtsH/Yme1/Tma family protein [bacterium]|nr:ATP-dependent metallopeptidase FtsH/Yme1/Tma family protein [bacterium]